MGSEAELEGFYRFVRNEKVSFEELVRPHVRATARRASEHEIVLVVHDTTEFRFPGDKRKGLGKLGGAHGFLGHFSLAVLPNEVNEPLGLLCLQTWTRVGPSVTRMLRDRQISDHVARSAEGRESERWLYAVGAAEEAVDGRTSLIHVMDSEADDYALMSAMVADGQRFVVRLGQDRVVEGSDEKVRANGVHAPTIATRIVQLSRRSQPIDPKDRRRGARNERQATLAIATRTLQLRRPNKLPAAFPASLEVNVVYVTELNPPSEFEAVEWILLTSEPIESKEQILRIVDHYRARWIIEEYFKALKTGCDFQKRQLESWDTLLVALGLFAPIAWNMLRLRALARSAPDTPASRALTDAQIQVLQLHPDTALKPRPRLKDALAAIARIGGHLRSNGEPGWLVLGRGYQQLLMLEVGFLMGRQTCDQS